MLDIIKSLQQHEQDLKRQNNLVVNPVEFELIPLDDAVADVFTNGVILNLH